MNRITRRFEFDAGHRVLGHESKCATLHGHRYVVEFQIMAATLDPLGRVVDFGRVKQVLGDMIDRFDHTMLLHPNDPLLELQSVRNGAALRELLGPRPPVIMPMGMNPTAENLAAVLLAGAIDRMTHCPVLNDVRVNHIRIYETPNCWADMSNLDIPTNWRTLVPCTYPPDHPQT